MKCSFILLFIQLTLTGIIWAGGVKGQRLDEGQVSLRLHRASLQESLLALQRQSGVQISFANALLAREAKKVTLDEQQITVREALRKILDQTNLTYRQEKDYIIIDARPPRQQPGTIRGRVVEQASGRPFPGATVRIIENRKGMVTDEQGYYRFSLPPGAYTVEASFIGYRTVSRKIQVAAGQEATCNFTLAVSNNALNAVEVQAARKLLQPVQHTSDREMLMEIRLSNSVVSGISSEQIGKQADVNAAQVVRRISGVTVTDEQFLVVRGMNQRYNVTYIDDNLAPSTEQYSRAFALNLLPTRIIDKILVYKSPRPDLFGDFAGGAVKVFTKDALAVKHMDVGIRLGYLPVSTFGHMNSYAGGKTDWLGFDDGSRKLPGAVPGFGNFGKAQLTPGEYINAFNPELTYGTARALPDMQCTFNYYSPFKIGSKQLYNVTALAYTNETRFNDDIYRQQGNTLVGHDFFYNNSLTHETRSTETGQLNLMQNFVLKLSDRHRLYFRNFVLLEGKKTTQVRISRPNNGIENVLQTKSNILGFNSRLLYTGNLGGNYLFRNSKHALSWNLGYTSTRYALPDQRVINLAASSQGEETQRLSWFAKVRDAGIRSRQQGIISRLFLDSREKLYNVSADYTYNLTPALDLKAGTYQFWKQRTLYRRIYAVHDALFTTLDDYPNIGYLPGVNAYVNPELVWFREQDLDKVWSTDYFRNDRTGLAVYDFTSPTDAYLATEQYNAGYVSLQARPWNGRLELHGGVRLEHDRQKIAAAQENQALNVPLMVDRPKTVWLPSVNASYRPGDKWVLRAGYGRTVNRPEFREIAPFEDFDYLHNEVVLGNVQLVTAMIDNIDLRLEHYPRRNKNEAFSIGAFYKHLDKPIERINFTSILSGAEETFTYITFRNADEAKVYGLEAEIRKSLSFIPGAFFRKLSLVANGAWIHSETWKDSIRLDERGQVRFARTFRRPLQGQAPYIVNVGLFYDNAASGTKASVTWNVSGTNIYAAGVFSPNNYSPNGSDTRGSILQLPRHLLDVAVTQRIARRWQTKLSVQNLLNKGIRWAEDNDFNNKYEPERLVDDKYVGDNISQQYNPGRYFLLSAVYSF